MARSFLGLPFANYRGQIAQLPNTLCPGSTNAGIVIDWANYGVGTSIPAFAVNLDLTISLGTPGPVIPKIRSVYIDNYGSNSPVYVFFPDTGFTVAAQANDACWFPVITNNLKAQIVGLNFIAGTQPKTRVFFTDAFVPPYSDLESELTFPQFLGSALIQRNSQVTPGFGSPALGDQAVSATLTATAAGFNVMLPAVPAGGFYYLTHLKCWLVGGTVGAGTATHNVVFQGVGGGNIIASAAVAIPNGFVTNGEIFHQQGNIRLDATVGYEFRMTVVTTVAGSGSYNCNLAYSYNLN